MKYSILLIGMAYLSSCILSTWDVRLILVNKTGKRIKFLNEIKNINNFIPDTAYCNTRDLYSVEANKDEVLRSQNRWEYLLENHPDRVLRIFIVNEDSLSKYGTCKIIKEEIFMKRFDLTYDDLIKLNWKIVYDPNN